jgi:hypothetical protein
LYTQEIFPESVTYPQRIDVYSVTRFVHGQSRVQAPVTAPFFVLKQEGSG